jgi:hypothetical protein
MNGMNDFENATDQQKRDAELYSRRIEIELLRRNRSAAVDLVDKALTAIKAPSSDGEFLNKPVAGIVDVRLANALEHHLGAVTIGQLLSHSQERLRLIPGIGDKNIVSIYAGITRAAIQAVDALEYRLAA